MRGFVVALCLGSLAGIFAAAQAADAPDRRGRRGPELILDTPGRTAACDVLVFTANTPTAPSSLLATGDDKVVRSWTCGENGLAEPAQVLRWNVWREQRGSIYALALSPDAENRRVVVGGLGVKTGALAVLDRVTGERLAALTEPVPENQRDPGAVWSLAFAPSGNQVACGKADGSIWVWNWKNKQPNDIHRLGKAPAGNSVRNPVRLVAYLSEHELISVAADGWVLRWDLNNPTADVARLFKFERTQHLYRVAISPAGHSPRWIAAAGQAVAAGENARIVEVRSLPNGRQVRAVELPEDHYPFCVALDAHGERLALGVRTIVPRATFAKEGDGYVTIYDLKDEQPRGVRGPRLKVHPEALAFHPDGVRFAVAGGEDHNVTLWKLPQVDTPISNIHGPGKCLWQVALDKSGQLLGFLDQPGDPRSVEPNRRGKGDLRKGDGRYFNLTRRVWEKGREFQPVEPLEKSPNGWRVEPDRTNSFLWYVRGPQGQRYPLSLDKDRDDMPRCYTFLPAQGNKPERLAVGHYWGITLFELYADREPRRVRLFTGHQGDVLSVAPSADYKVLVTASRDQTIAAWSLADWPYHPELGAEFSVRDGKLLVTRVAPGSPIWEAGLVEGDEIVAFAFNGKLLFNRTSKYGGQRLGSPEQTLEQIQKPEPGREFYFEWKPVSGKELLKELTTVRQRPLWRFFPTEQNEWVLWRWRDYYYDTSVHGDEYIGWLDGADPAVVPTFCKAEQLETKFHRPDKVVEVLRGTQVQPDQVIFPDLVPPRAVIQVAAAKVKDADAGVNLTVTPQHPDEKSQALKRVVLMVNDYIFQAWEGNALNPKELRQQNIVIPQGQLRRGRNTLTVVCYNEAGGRGEARAQVEFTSDKPLQVNLYGLAVGVNDYTHIRGVRADNLRCAVSDARSVREAWLQQRGTDLYREEVDFQLLENQQVTRENVLKLIRDLAMKVKPDDWVIFYLAGHGMNEGTERAAKPGTFVYLCWDFDRAAKDRTGITALDLHNALAELNCHKLLLLDACHSGDLPANPIREVRHGEQVALIVAACEPYELSAEDRIRNHGFFTLAVVEALETNFSDADADRDNYLDSHELVSYVEKRVRDLAGADQHPRYSPQSIGPVRLAQRKMR